MDALNRLVLQKQQVKTVRKGFSIYFNSTSHACEVLLKYIIVSIYNTADTIMLNIADARLAKFLKMGV